MIIIGDLHLGNKSGGIDRTQDIFDKTREIIYFAIKNKHKYVVFLGDITHTSNPSPEIVAKVIQLCNMLEDAEIETFILVGNHDRIDVRGKTSSLEPISEINYSFISIVNDIDLYVPLRTDSNNEYAFLFIPHIGKAQLAEINSKIKEDKYKNVDDYISKRVRSLIEVTNREILVFSHVNVDGGIVGTEDFMLKGIKNSLPDFLKTNNKIKYIFNGHLHKYQIINSKNAIIMPGSVERLDFGERNDQKMFIEFDEEGNKRKSFI